MTDPTLIADLIRAGVDAALVGRVSNALLEVAAPRPEPPGPSKAAARTRRWRESKASQTVTGDASVTPENQDDKASQDVTERHRDVTGDGTPLYKESKREVTQRTDRHRGERLPADWVPSKADLEFASSKGMPRTRVENEAERFRNYWTSKPGKTAVKLDWGATWRNWVLQSLDRHPVANGGTDEQDWRKAIL